MKQFKMPNDVHWIGVERFHKGFAIETSYFKKIFDLQKPIKEAPIYISANERFRLYVNGKEVLNGPCRGDQWHQYCDTIDIAAYLTEGTNVIAVKVVAYTPVEATNDTHSNYGPIWSMSNSAGPLLIVHGEFGGVDISTGRSDWYYRNDTAIGWELQQVAFWMGCTEDVEGSKLPHGWEKTAEIGQGFVPAKAKWSNQVRHGEIHSLFLYEKPIKNQLRLDYHDLGVLTGDFPIQSQTDDQALIVPANSTHEAILDAKQLTTSFVYLPCAGGEGSQISLLYSEAFSKMEGQRRYKEDRTDTSGELIGVEDIYRPGGGLETYSPTWFRTFRFIKITIKTGDKPLKLYPLKLIETRYPLDNNVRFETLQPWIKKVWDISHRTLELCMHETYEDCPFYEQLQYTMDTRLQMLFTYAMGNGIDMQTKTIHDFHTSILPEGILQSRFPSKFTQVIPAFSLHWIFMLKDYYIETGDLTLLERYRPTMENVLAWYKRKTGPQGLVEYLTYWDFADWTEAWRDISGTARASLHGPSTIQNLVYAYALDVGNYIMKVLGINELGNRYETERNGILKKIDSLCWSEKRGLFKDGPDYKEYTQHAQIWAVLNGLVRGKKAEAIMARTLSDQSLIPCSFVMQFYLFRALEQVGMYKETEKLWDLWKELLDWNLSTVPEIPGKYARSDCHAWGSLMLYELPRKFLGVLPLEPGYEKILIQPIGFYVNEISGEVPTPKGPVQVKWVMKEGRFTIEGTSPVPAEVVLPDGTSHMAEGAFCFSCL